jgi:DNA invertase Pin-like site-specific DNA recombinase
MSLADGMSPVPRIAAFYVENISGTTIMRPALNRLLEESEPGDVILIESIDRLTRLSNDQWGDLRRIIEDKGIHVVSLDLPTSHMVFNTSVQGEFMSATLGAINRMLLDILAASSYKEFKERERKQAEGIEIAKQAGKYKGRKINSDKFETVKRLTESTDFSINDVAKTVGLSRSTIIRYRKLLDTS